jgi:hypothetical protein
MKTSLISWEQSDIDSGRRHKTRVEEQTGDRKKQSSDNNTQESAHRDELNAAEVAGQSAAPQLSDSTS